MRKGLSIKRIRSIDRAFKILDSFTNEKPNLKLKEIVNRTGLNRSTVYRILYTLELNGIITYDSESKYYSLGLKIFELGGIYSSNFEEKKVISNYLDKIKSKVHHTILVGTIYDDQLMYIDKRESRKELRVSSNIGKKRPPHYGILGKIMMAYQPTEEIDRLLEKHPLKNYASNSITDNDKFKKRLTKIKKNDCVIAYSEAIDGVVGVGVPLFKSGEVYAGLGVIAPKSIMNKKEIKDIKNILMEYSNIISRELG